MRPASAALLLVLVAACASGQNPGSGPAASPPPVLDMHLHAIPADAQGPPPLGMCTPVEAPSHVPGEDWSASFMRLFKNPSCEDPVWSPTTDEELMRRTLAVMERRNVIGVTSGPQALVARWRAAAPDRIIPALSFNLAADTLTPGTLRRMHARGDLAVLGEVTNQYAGIEPADPRFAPYLAVAAELDIPVGIHIGTGPPGAPYLGFDRYRARLHSPLLLEEVLVRHPRLRVYVMHAGWPMLDDMLAVLWAHPQVYVDVGIIVYGLPRAEFYRYLRTLVDAGFGSRIMFGSDQMVWPETLDRAIRVIEEAPFLTHAQKRAILYDNAARFLRLSDEERAAHAGG